jgi:hypothetical protein
VATDPWAEWREREAKVAEAAARLASQKPYDWMISIHGIDPGGHVCAECGHFVDKADYGEMTRGKYFKCLKYAKERRRLGGPKTDWRKRWRACGVFTRDREE